MVESRPEEEEEDERKSVGHLILIIEGESFNQSEPRGVKYANAEEERGLRGLQMVRGTSYWWDNSDSRVILAGRERRTGKEGQRKR